MASDYGNLGNVYLTRGELDKAKDMYYKSLILYKEMGALDNADAKETRELLDKLLNKKT